MTLISYENFTLEYLNGGYWDGVQEGANLASEERMFIKGLHPDHLMRCPYCRHPMTFKDSDLNEFAQTSIHSCTRCGWWTVRAFSTALSEADVVYSNAYICDAVAKKYSVSDKTAPVAALHHHLRRHINDLAHVNPKRLEQLVASVLTDFFGTVNTKHVGGNDDQGIDVLCCRTATEDFLVQVKRREDLEKNEAFAVVDAILGACVRFFDDASTL